MAQAGQRPMSESIRRCASPDNGGLKRRPSLAHGLSRCKLGHMSLPTDIATRAALLTIATHAALAASFGLGEARGPLVAMAQQVAEQAEALASAIAALDDDGAQGGQAGCAAAPATPAPQVLPAAPTAGSKTRAARRREICRLAYARRFKELLDRDSNLAKPSAEIPPFPSRPPPSPPCEPSGFPSAPKPKP